MSTTLASVSPPSPRSDRLLTPPPPSCLRPRSLLKASVGLGVLAARGNDPPRPQGGDGESRRGRYSLGQRGPGYPPLAPNEELGSAFATVTAQLKGLGYYVSFDMLNAELVAFARAIEQKRPYPVPVDQVLHGMAVSRKYSW